MEFLSTERISAGYYDHLTPDAASAARRCRQLFLHMVTKERKRIADQAAYEQEKTISGLKRGIKELQEANIDLRYQISLGSGRLFQTKQEMNTRLKLAREEISHVHGLNEQIKKRAKIVVINNDTLRKELTEIIGTLKKQTTNIETNLAADKSSGLVSITKNQEFANP